MLHIDFKDKDILGKIFIVLPYLVLAFVLFVIFARGTDYREREKYYRGRIEVYKQQVETLDRKVTSLETSISHYKDSVATLEKARILLEWQLQHIRQENEQTVAHIVSSDTDWNIRFLSEYLSEEDSVRR